MGCSICARGEVEEKQECISTPVNEEAKDSPNEDPIPVLITPEKLPVEIIIHLQGELLKQQANSKEKYASRWAQLTSEDFRYYKNEYTAAF